MKIDIGVVSHSDDSYYSGHNCYQTDSASHHNQDAHLMFVPFKET